MVSKMKAIGMSEEVLARLSPEQRAQIFAMTKNPAIMAKAEDRVRNEVSADKAAELGVEGRSADGQATPVKGEAYK